MLPTEWAGCAHKEGLRERRGRKRKEKERRRKEKRNKKGKRQQERKSKTFGRRNKATRAAPARAGSRGGAPGR